MRLDGKETGKKELIHLSESMFTATSVNRIHKVVHNHHLFMSSILYKSV